ISIEWRFAEGREARLPELLAELIALPVDVILAAGPAPTQAAKHATTTVPIVMCFGGDPIGVGLIASLARPGGNVTGLAARIAELAATSRLPVTASSKEFAEAGALLTYGAGIVGMYGRAATFVDKILKGARPADLPVEQPATFDCVINLKTAQALGLSVPQTA